MVNTMAELDTYSWCGHSVLLGRLKSDWLDRDYVLSWFGETEGEARRKYVKSGVEEGIRPDLVGGGLVRTKRWLVAGCIHAENG